MYIDFHMSICDLLSTVGNMILRLPTWDTNPEETQKLMLAFGELQRTACHN